MVVIKEIKKITIDIPADFPSDQAEVIILPYIPETKNIRKKQRESLINAPTIDNNELQKLTEIRDYLNQWNIKEF